jgi:hypothetical protein
MRSSFRMLIGHFAVVATTGQDHDSLPARKSEAGGYDVIDRKATGDEQYVCRDRSFLDAFDICVRRASFRQSH